LNIFQPGAFMQERLNTEVWEGKDEREKESDCTGNYANAAASDHGDCDRIWQPGRRLQCLGKSSADYDGNTEYRSRQGARTLPFDPEIHDRNGLPTSAQAR
jgi:hypothetical protein